MENRDRDKVSHSSVPTTAGKVNREVSERRGQEENPNADFGQKTGQDENLESPARPSGGTGSSEGRH